MLADQKLELGKNIINTRTDNERVSNIVVWIKKNKHIIDSCETIKVNIHVKGKHITGTIEIYPDSVV